MQFTTSTYTDTNKGVGQYTKDRAKDGGDKKKVAVYYKKKVAVYYKKKVAVYYKKKFVYMRQVLKEYNIICYQVGYPLGTQRIDN